MRTLDFRKLKQTPVDKAKVRKEINRDIEAFIAKGGKIVKYARGTGQPLVYKKKDRPKHILQKVIDKEIPVNENTRSNKASSRVQSRR